MCLYFFSDLLMMTIGIVSSIRVKYLLVHSYLSRTCEQKKKEKNTNNGRISTENFFTVIAIMNTKVTYWKSRIKTFSCLLYTTVNMREL